MLGLPLIVAAGGINSAGRTSHRHGYRRLVIDDLDSRVRATTEAALAQLMNGADPLAQREGTLIRRIEASAFDIAAVPWNRQVTLSADQGPVTFETGLVRGTEGLPRDWSMQPLDNGRLKITTGGEPQVLFPSTRRFEVGAAGQLPSGFDPAALYPSRNHPRGLQMTVFAASDALADLGIDWEQVCNRVSPEQVSVYVSSSMGQLDDDGTGGMLKARAGGRRVTSKQCPLGFAEMPGDFINAYLLRSLGNTGPALGACATFLYNLRLAVADIRAGRARVAIVGAAEAPVNPEVMDGYVAMGALATDKGLLALDGLPEDGIPDHRRACRPFGENCGFTMAESAQVVILMDDALALELGAPVLGAVPEVFVHADGAKKSISGPGAGNYLTMARAVAVLRGILGEQRLQTGGMVQAHGTGTPQNRVTESRILDRVAAAFGIRDWPVAAIKSFVGHSLGAAGGDQLAAQLGIWEHGRIPGITTTAALADDVSRDHLDFVLTGRPVDAADYAVVNSKGFGGNNASAAVLSGACARELLERHHGADAIRAWRGRHERVEADRQAIEARRLSGDWAPLYRFDDGVLGDDDIALSADAISFAGRAVALEPALPPGWSLD